MRLLKVDITGFGHYRHQTIAFDPHNQLFYGENEAGKSTLYQFIYAMLFGFTKKSAKKRDYTPQDGAAYGGRLWFTTTKGQTVKIERFRQIDRGRAKVWIDEQEVPSQQLATLIEPLTAQVFQEIYTFQQEQLSQIDHLQDQEFHEALLSLGVSGSQQLMEVVQNEERASQLAFRPRGRNLPLNQKILQLEKLEEKIADKEQQEAKVQTLYQQVHEQKQQVERVEQTIQELRQQQQQLAQQELNWTLYEEWQTLQHTAPALVLTPEEQHQLAALYQTYQTVRQDIQQKTDQIAQTEQDQVSERYFFYLDHETELKQIKGNYRVIVQAIEQERINLETQYELERQLTFYAKRWRFTKETPPHTIDPQLYQDLADLEEKRVHQRQIAEKIHWQEQKQEALELEVDQLEQQLLNLEPEAKSIVERGAVLGVAIVSLIVLLINIWLGSALLLATIGVAVVRHKPKSNQALAIVKAQWQAKLAESDQNLVELDDLDQRYKAINHEIHQLLARLQPFFGNTPQNEWQEALATYQREAEKFTKILAQKQTVQAELDAVQTFLDTVYEQLKPFYAWISIASLSLSDQLDALFVFEEEMQQIKVARSQQENMKLATAIQALRQQEKELLSQAQTLFAKVGIHDPSEIPVLVKQWNTQQAQQTRAAELQAMLGQLFPVAITKAEWTTQQEQNETALVQAQETYRKQTIQIQRLELELEQLQQDGTLDEWYQKRTQLADEVRQMSMTWATQKVHAALLTQLATTRSKAQFPALMQKVKEYFSLLTNGRYQQVEFHEGILTIADQTMRYDVYQLSTGTKDQLIMAFRFAYLALQEDPAICPVIIDDGWLHYDHKRKAQLATLLQHFGQEAQVICLSSDREMVSYYQERNQAVSWLTERM